MRISDWSSDVCSSDLACSPNGFSWTYSTYALANGTGTALVEQGGKSWFFLTSDYAFGLALDCDTSAAVKAAGGTVVWSVRHPLNNADFSSFLPQAQVPGEIGRAHFCTPVANAQLVFIPLLVNKNRACE